ncbi:hypothetical protein PHYC_00808 [Phycisphaerales bacterium]|nr:hypothetical protein PHYC_00808 [Phycisphaerales bacterium]
MRPIVLFLVVIGAVALSPAAMAQRARGVNPDDSVIAPDALTRMRELADVGNVPEALRVLQSVLESEGDRLLASESDEDLYLPVRRIVHAMLLRTPELLTRYRDQEGPRAAQLLGEGDLAGVERSRFLTSAGLEATLRLAQMELESGRFESARLYLEQLEVHPDRRAGSREAKDAAALAMTIASFLRREPATAWAERWAKEASLEGAVLAAPPAPELSRPSRTPLDATGALDLSTLPAIPLQSAVIDVRPAETGEDTPSRSAWVFPTLSGDLVFVGDTSTLQARDATTLAPLWNVSFSAIGSGGRQGRDNDPLAAFTGLNTGIAVDPAMPVVGRGVVVSHNAGFEGDPRRFRRTIFGFDARSGRLLWGTEPGTADTRLEASTIRGPAAVADDCVIVAMREQGVAVRVSRVHLAGMDLHTGQIRWVRLLGNVGTNPWGRGIFRPDMSVVSEGVVYRGDEMGVLGAFEAATGRPRWVRLTRAARPQESMRWPANAVNPAYEACAPVFAGGSLYYIEPGPFSVIRVGAADGKLESRRDGASLGDPRYLVMGGGRLGCVGSTRVAFVDPDALADGPVHFSPEYRVPGIAGRCVVAGGRVLVPLNDALVSVDPMQPTEDSRVPLPAAGNILVVTPPDSESAHLLAVDSRSLHLYVSWEQAKALLDRRVTQSPKDPAPLLTYVELLYRAGQCDRVPPLADAALRLLDANRLTDESRAARQRLYELLLGMVRQARREWAQPAVVPSAERSLSLEAPPIKDPAVLRAILDRVGRCADTPQALAWHLLEVAWFAETQDHAKDAIDAYQQILLDPSLGEAAAGDASGQDHLGSSATASDEAAASLARILRRVGPAPYAAFDEEARLAVQALPANVSAEQLADLARKYPAAAVSADVWLRSGEKYAAQGKSDEARAAVGAGLSAAELSGAIGRSDQDRAVARLASAFAGLAGTALDEGAMYRTFRRLARDYPTLSLNMPEGVRTPQEVARGLRERLGSRDWTPIIGTSIRVGQVIEGHDPLVPIFHQSPGLATDCLATYDETAEEVWMWGVDAASGLLRPLWMRDAGKQSPNVILMTPDAAVLHWPGPTGGSLEAISIDGTSLWRTPEFSVVFGGAEPGPPERIPTPLDGQVRSDDLIVSTDGATLALLLRSGPMAVFDVATGRTLWSASVPVSRVYEVTHVGSTIVVAGAARTAEGQPLQPAVIALDARTGDERSRLDARVVGDHPRWIRSLPDGDAVMACATGLTRYSPTDGTIRWTTPGDPARGSIAGWVVKDAIFVLDSDLRLWRADGATGKFGDEALDTRDRLSPPVQGAVTGDRLILASVHGVLVFDATGKLVGADAIESSHLEPIGFTRDMIVGLDLPGTGFESPEGEIARLAVLSNPGGKLIATERLRIYAPPTTSLLLDGKIVIGQGAATIVLDARPAK